MWLSGSKHDFSSLLEAVRFLSEGMIFGNVLTLSNLPTLGRTPSEKEALEQFSGLFLKANYIGTLKLSNLHLDRPLATCLDKCFAESSWIGEFNFSNVKCISPECAKIFEKALLKRDQNSSLTISLGNASDVLLVVPILNFTAAKGGKLIFSEMDLSSINAVQCLRRWVIRCTFVTEISFVRVRGLSNISFAVLMKGLRYFSNLSLVDFSDTDVSTGALLMLCDSLSGLESTQLCLKIGVPEIRDAAILKLTELFLDSKKTIVSAYFQNVKTSTAKKLLSTRAATYDRFLSLAIQNTSFVNQHDFDLFACGLKRLSSFPFLLLTADCFSVDQRQRLRDIEGDVEYPFLFFG